MKAAGSPPFAEGHTSCGICKLQALKCFYRLRHMKRISAESALGDFTAVWKVWLSRSTQELSDDEQEDVVDPAAANVYRLEGSGTSDTPVEEDAGGADGAGGAPDLTVPMAGARIKNHNVCIHLYWCLYWSVFGIVLVCIGLYWDHIVECIGISI